MEAPSLDRRLVAILAADVEGYSRLMALDEEATLATLSSHRAAADQLIVSFRGRIANTAGDSVLAEFASVVDAVRCALGMQEAIAGLNAAIADHRRMSFRIGINVGDIIAKDGDIFGDGVNIAARLQTLATAGGICVSRGVRDHIRHLDSFRFEDLGEQQVRNIDRPVRAFRVIVDAGRVPDMGGTPPDPPELSTQAPVDDTALLDIALWETVRDGDRVAEFLHYLERFPDGEFAALARDRIAALSVPTTAPVAMPADVAIELTFWESVTASDTPALYDAYLEQYPQGSFAVLARAKLKELG